jgi:hypothetical protein
MIELAKSNKQVIHDLSTVLLFYKLWGFNPLLRVLFLKGEGEPERGGMLFALATSLTLNKPIKIVKRFMKHASLRVFIYCSVFDFRKCALLAHRAVCPTKNCLSLTLFIFILN